MSTADRSTIKVEAVPDEGLGQTLGRYKLLERLGEGGFGVVYVAEQKEPVKRRVAIKIIKLGMDTRQVVARFEAERQALALMDHPNIAKVLDAGATESGRPYFVMELVRGVRLTDYCDQNKLSTKRRLELFIPVCQAIQHAHQKGIIHRDIKPSNILVTLHDGVPVPKVIDFGIAKATQQDLTDKTVYTQLQQFVGTPAYMSPEQAEMSGLDVDTRSDIYSLGVLLYELLTGRTPFDPKELMSQGIDAMRKTIREKEPVRPSTRVATLQGEELSTTAARRAAEAPKLVSLLRGDLDWIVMKCLEKDRTRRYETANGLAFDLKRHLSNEPVLARPPSAAYKLQKAFGRHKVAFAAGIAIVVALILGVAGTTVGLLRARRAQAMALRTRSEAEKLSNFMLEDFYSKLEPSGQFDMVAQLARQAVAYYDSLPASLRTAETERNRATAQARLGLILARQGDAEEAIPLAAAASSSFDRMRHHGDNSEPTLFGSGLSLFGQAWAYRFRNEAGQIRVLEQGVELLKPCIGSSGCSRRIKLLYADLLDQLGHLRSPEQAVELHEQALRVLAGLGALDWSDLTAASAWADTADSEAREALRVGNLDDAQRLEKQTQTIAEGVLARRPGDLRAMKDLGEAAEMLAMCEAHRFRETNALAFASQAQRAVAEYVRFNPSDEFSRFQFTWDYYVSAAISFRLGRVGEALQKAQAGTELPAATGTKEKDSIWTASLFGVIAEWEAQRGNRAAAEDNLSQARRKLDATSTRTPGWNRPTTRDLCDKSERQVKMAFGEHLAAYTLAQSALDRLAAPERPKDGGAALTTWQLCKAHALADAAQAALALGRYSQAESAAQALLAIRELENDYSHLEILLGNPADGCLGRVLLAEAALGQGRRDDALKTIEPALANYRDAQARGATHVFFLQHFARALCIQASAQPDDASGTAQRRASLEQAARLLNALSDEAQQLRDTKELRSRIAAERKKLTSADSAGGALNPSQP
jgi:tRNA A-37 threonylcarbamoyl transferase component Bud32